MAVGERPPALLASTKSATNFEPVMGQVTWSLFYDETSLTIFNTKLRERERREGSSYYSLAAASVFIFAQWKKAWKKGKSV